MRIAFHSKFASAFALVPMITTKHSHDEALLEVANSLGIENAGLVHLSNERLKLVLHRASKITQKSSQLRTATRAAGYERGDDYLAVPAGEVFFSESARKSAFACKLLIACAPERTRARNS